MVSTPPRNKGARGELSTSPPEHLVLRAFAQKLSGTLEIGPSGALDIGKPEAAIVFSRGLVRRIKTSEPLYLSAILWERGYVDAERMNESLREVARTKRPHGYVLRAMGAIERRDLEEALREQVERRLSSLVTLSPSFAWAFHIGVDTLATYGTDDWPLVDPTAAIWAGVRENVSDEQVARALAKVKNHPVRLLDSFEVTRYRFNSEELAIVARLRRTARAGDFAGDSERTRSLAERMIYCFVVARELDIMETPDASPEPAPATVPASGAYRTAKRRESEEETPVALMVPADVQCETMRRRARTIESESFFRALGLGRDATSTDVQAAYFRLSNVWHPDRLPPELQSVREDAAKVFAHLTRAYNTLTNAEERAAYVLDLADGTVNADSSGAASDPAVDFHAAEMALGRGQRDRAASLALRAHRARPNEGDFAALVVWLDALRPESQDDEATHRFIARLDDVIATKTPSMRAYFYRGLLHKRVNDGRAALRDFRDVLVFEPGHADAAQEIRVLEMRIRNGTLDVRTTSGERRLDNQEMRHDSVGKMLATWLRKG